MLWRVSTAKLLYMLVRGLRAIGNFIGNFSNGLEGMVTGLGGNAVETKQYSPDINLDQRFEYGVRQDTTNLVKDNQKLTRNASRLFQNGSPPRHWREYVQDKLAKQSVPQYQTYPSERTESNSDVLDTRHDTTEKPSERTVPAGSEEKGKRQQLPRAVNQPREEKETDTVAEYLQSNQTKRGESGQYESPGVLDTRTYPSEQKESNNDAFYTRYDTTEESSERIIPVGSEEKGKRQQLPRSEGQTGENREIETRILYIKGETNATWKEDAGSKDKQEKENMSTESILYRHYNTTSTDSPKKGMPDQELISPSKLENWQGYPRDNGTLYTLKSIDDLRFPKEQPVREGITYPTEPGEQHWPALMDIQRYQYEQALTAQDWENQLRTWHRRQRLNEEQKGVLWSE